MNSDILQEVDVKMDHKEEVVTPKKVDAILKDYFQLEPKKIEEVSSLNEKDKTNPVCEACCESAIYPNKDDPLTRFIYCKICLACVHLKCYGKNIPLYELPSKDGKGTDLMFICDKCQYCKDKKARREDIQCILCCQKSGLMKRVCIENKPKKIGEFCHNACGFYCDQIEIKDIGKMVFYRKETDIMKFENEFKCAFCSSSQGFMLKCDHYQCKNQAHPFCINEERRAMAAKNDGAASTWQILHKDSVSDNCKAIPDRQGLGIIGYEGSELVEDYRSNKWKRGGLISFFCEIHRQLDEYCICGSQEDESQSSFMIECEACEMWYHGECVGISSQEGNNMNNYYCEKCYDWEEKRQSLLYSICSAQSIKPEILNDIDKYPSGIMPESSKNLKFIDFLIIAEAWNKVSNILLSSSRDVSRIIRHLRVVEKIPINCESKIQMLVIVVKQSLVSASKILPNFEELKKYKPLEILTPEGETDEDNIEQNQKSLGILSEACQDIDPSKIESSPGLKILVKTIDCLKLLEGISKYYDKNYTGPKTFEEYKELFKDLKTTPYRGNLFAIMEEEINDYKLFKEDAEYIINKEIDGDSCSEDSGSDGDLTKQELMDYKVRKWKYRVNHKVDKRSFLKVLKNGNEHKIGCEEYLKKLNRIHDACNEYEQLLNQSILCAQRKLTIEESEEIIQKGIDLVIVPKQSFQKALNQYKKCATFSISWEQISASTPENKVDYSKLKDLVQYLDDTCFTNHCLTKPQIKEIRKIYSECQELQMKIKSFRSTEPDQLQALYNEIQQNTRIALPGLHKLHQKIICCRILSSDSYTDPIQSSMTEVESILEDLVENKLRIPGKNNALVYEAIKAKVEYTIKAMKKQPQWDTIEIVTKAIQDIKTSGIYLTPIYTCLNDHLLSLDWLKETSKDIWELYKSKYKRNPPDDLLYNKDSLSFISDKKLKKYFEIARKVKKVIGHKANLVYKNLCSLKWAREYKEHAGDDITKISAENRRNLIKLGTELSLDTEEFQRLKECDDHSKIINKFKKSKDPSVLDELLLMKWQDLSSSLKTISNKVKINEMKQEKLEEIINLVKISEILRKVIEVVKIKDEPIDQDLYGLRDSDHPFTTKNSQGEEMSKEQMEYNKIVELLDIAETKGLPDENPWYKLLRESTIKLEKWQSQAFAYEEWKEKNEGKMNQVLKRTKEIYSIEKLDDILNQIDGLIIQPNEEIADIKADIKTVKEWLYCADTYLDKITNNRKKIKMGFSVTEREKLLNLFTDLKNLPCISTDYKSTMELTMIYHYLCIADKYLITVSSQEDSSQEELTFTKHSFSEWTKLNSVLEGFKDHPVVYKNDIYQKFIRSYKESQDVHSIFYKGRQNHLKVKKKGIDLICQEASNCKVNFEKEIEDLQKKYEQYMDIENKLKVTFEHDTPIDTLLSNYSLAQSAPFGFESEQKEFKRQIKTYRQMKTKLTAIMANKKEANKMEITKVHKELSKVKNFQFTFQEGEEFKLFAEQDKNSFLDLQKEVTTICNTHKILTYPEYAHFESRLKTLAFTYDHEQTELQSKLSLLFKVCLSETFKTFILQHQKSPTSPFLPKSAQIPLAKVSCTLDEFREEKSQKIAREKDQQEYQLEIDSHSSSNSGGSQGQFRFDIDVRGMKVDEVLAQVARYVAFVRSEVKGFATYPLLNTYLTTLSQNSFIDFTKTFESRLKKLYKQMPRSQRKATKKPTHKRAKDSDEEWDKPTHDQDVEMEPEEPNQLKKVKNKTASKSKPKPKKEAKKPTKKEPKSVKAKNTKPKKAQGKKREVKAKQKTKETAVDKQKQIAKKAEAKKNLNSTMERLKQRLGASKGGNSKDDFLKSLLKKKEEEPKKETSKEEKKGIEKKEKPKAKPKAKTKTVKAKRGSSSSSSSSSGSSGSSGSSSSSSQSSKSSKSSSSPPPKKQIKPLKTGPKALKTTAKPTSKKITKIIPKSTKQSKPQNPKLPLKRKPLPSSPNLPKPEPPTDTAASDTKPAPKLTNEDTKDSSKSKDSLQNNSPLKSLKFKRKLNKGFKSKSKGGLAASLKKLK